MSSIVISSLYSSSQENFSNKPDPTMALSRPSDPFSKLPPEMLMEIIKYLGREDRLHLCLASARVRKAIGQQNLAPLSESYRLYGRNCLGARISPMNVTVSFNYPGDVFQKALRAILEARGQFFLTAKQTVIVLAPNVRASIAFAEYLRNEKISWFDVILSDGFVPRATRSEIRKSLPGHLTVVVTHRADGALPTAGHVLALAPRSAQDVQDLVYFSPTVVSILWPYHEAIGDKYYDVLKWLWFHDRTNVPKQLFFLKPTLTTVASGETCFS